MKLENQTALGRRCIVVVADLGAQGQTEVVSAQIESAFDHLDILVNNAGLGRGSNPKPVVDFDNDFWERSLYLNLTVPYLLCKRVMCGMFARKYGRIINIASINGKIGAMRGAAYAASKHGLLGLTRTLALECSGDGITVNAICPGPVHMRIFVCRQTIRRRLAHLL